MRLDDPPGDPQTGGRLRVNCLQADRSLHESRPRLRDVRVRRDVVDGVVLSVGRAGVEVLDSPGSVDSATEVVDNPGGGPGDLG